MKPAGIEHAQGIISAAFMKDPTDARWKDNAGMKKFDEFLKAYMPDANRSDDHHVRLQHGPDHGRGAEERRR